jgi:hypothetical protein
VKKTLMRGAVAFGAIIIIILGIALTKPDTFRVERSISINAPAGRILPYVTDLHRWIAWSPFEKLDPAMKRTYSGSGNGTGAVYAWNGDSHAGSGRMEILDTSSTRIVIKLDFLTPVEGHNIAEFTFQSEGDSTRVTWAMYGPNHLLEKVIGVFLSMDSMLGKEFETGLASLKNAAEKQSPAMK